MLRILIAEVAGGFAMYVVMSLLHMSPIAQTGISTLQSDDATIAALKDATGDKPGSISSRRSTCGPRMRWRNRKRR